MPPCSNPPTTAARRQFDDSDDALANQAMSEIMNASLHATFERPTKPQRKAKWVLDDSMHSSQSHGSRSSREDSGLALNPRCAPSARSQRARRRSNEDRYIPATSSSTRTVTTSNASPKPPVSSRHAKRTSPPMEAAGDADDMPRSRRMAMINVEAPSSSSKKAAENDDSNSENENDKKEKRQTRSGRSKRDGKKKTATLSPRTKQRSRGSQERRLKDQQERLSLSPTRVARCLDRPTNRRWREVSKKYQQHSPRPPVISEQERKSLTYEDLLEATAQLNMEFAPAMRRGAVVNHLSQSHDAASQSKLEYEKSRAWMH